MTRGLRMRRATAGAVTLAMAVVVSFNCFAGRDLTPEERACCAAMEHDCGATAIEKQCCSGEALKLDSTAPMSVTLGPAAPVAVLLAVLDPLEPILLDIAQPIAANASAKPPGPPGYELASILRI
jgi:hypothetical protein